MAVTSGVKAVSVVINGQTHTLSYNSNTGKYEATITAPAASSYPKTDHYLSLIHI